MERGNFKTDFWTRVLAEHGLESPGYHEAVKATNEHTAKKKIEQDAVKPKTRKKK